MFCKENLDLQGYDRIPRESVKHNYKTSGSEAFKDGRLTFTEAQLKKETERCLGCGAAVVDEYMCVGCGQCTTKCKFDAISLVRTYDSKGAGYEELKPLVLKQIVKREVKIISKNIKNVFVKE